MQRASNTWRVTTFGANQNLGPQTAELSRFARGTIPRITGSKNGELGNPVVWFKKDKTSGLSEKVSEAFREQSVLPRRRGNTVITNIPTEKLGSGNATIAEDIQKVLSEVRDTETTVELEEETPALEPDAIFSSGDAPMKLGTSKPKNANSPTSRKRLATVDLWTIVVGTLVLSIGAQYLLQGFGLANL